jgi:L-ascorbate metabolism protein UlaG (beta-lactamase superfamily)
VTQRLTWLGQAGFRLTVEGVEVVIDPWVSAHESRLIPPPPLALAAEGIDWVLVTHEHLDHLDLAFLPVVLERSPAARVVLPASLLSLVEDVVPEARLVPVGPYDTVDLGGLETHVVPACHGVTMEDAYGDGSALGAGPRFVGYVLGAERRIYHAGDTIVTDELTAVLQALGPDVALLPVNGRDAAREAQGIVGNMNAVEAVDLALAIGAARLVPYHWDGFAGNTVRPETVTDAASGRLPVVIPEHFVALETALEPGEPAEPKII